MGAVCGKPDDADGAGPDRAGFKSSATKAELRWLEIGPPAPADDGGAASPPRPPRPGSPSSGVHTPSGVGARSRSMDGSYGSIRDGSRAGASHSGPHPSPGTLGGVPAPFAHVADSRSSAGGGRAGLGSAAGARGGRGLTAAEAEIHRLRACVRETEGRLEEERLVFSAVLEEERAAHRRWRERAASEAAAGGDPSRGFPAVIHTTQGTLLDRRFLVGLGTGSNPGGGGVGGGDAATRMTPATRASTTPRREESATHDG